MNKKPNKERKISIIGTHFTKVEKSLVLRALKLLNERVDQYGGVSLASFVRSVVMKEVDAIIKKGA